LSDDDKELLEKLRLVQEQQKNMFKLNWTYDVTPEEVNSPETPGYGLGLIPSPFGKGRSK